MIERENDIGCTSANIKNNETTESLETMTNDEFLTMVGARVRQNRLHINMSRKLLAKRSGVSERYLAQLESGQGNMSLKLLRKVSMAIGVKVDALTAEQSVTTPLTEQA